MEEIDIKPRNDNILLEKLDSKVKEETILELPDNPQGFDEVYKGKVLATGPGRKSPEGFRFEVSMEPDDTVLYKQYAGHKVKELSDNDNETTVWLVNEKDVLAILK